MQCSHAKLHFYTVSESATSGESSLQQAVGKPAQALLRISGGPEQTHLDKASLADRDKGICTDN